MSNLNKLDDIEKKILSITKDDIGAGARMFQHILGIKIYHGLI